MEAGRERLNYSSSGSRGQFRTQGTPGTSGDEDEAQEIPHRSNAPKSKARLEGQVKEATENTAKGVHCSSARPNKFETLEILVWIGMHSADQPVLGIIPKIGMRSARRAASALKEKCPQSCVGTERELPAELRRHGIMRYIPATLCRHGKINARIAASALKHKCPQSCVGIE
ncbi:hypothetical protein DFH09DRAFT_1087275 [Mycena vulgaris]|nr:hypothetical protein DFH09DRAFT_1087275 [Mycena vulgaris]